MSHGGSLPHDNLAERSLLGAVIHRGERLAEVRAIIADHDFYSERHRRIYRAILQLVDSGAPLDEVNLIGWMRNQRTPRGDSVLELAGGLAYVTGLTVDIHPNPNPSWWALTIKRCAAKRAVLESTEIVARAAKNGVDFEELIKTVQANAETLGEVLSLAAGSRRHGLERIDLATLFEAAEEPIPWVIPGWLSEADIAVVAAEGGMGKSILAMDLALALATATEFLGLLPVQGGPHRVMLVDEENGPRLARHRLRQLIRGRGITDPSSLDLRYLSQNSVMLDSPASRKLLVQEIQVFRPEWIVLDTLIRIHAGDENDNAEMAVLFNAHLRPLRAEYGCGFVLLHHLAKPSKERTEAIHRVRGASELVNMADQVWALEGDRHTQDRILKHEKSRWTSKLQPDLSMHYEEQQHGESAVLRASEAVKDAEAILREALHQSGDEGMLRIELMNAGAAAGCHDKMVQRAMGKLHGQHSVKKRTEGKQTRYWLAIFAPGDAE